MVSGEPFEGARRPAGKAGPNSSIRLYLSSPSRMVTSYLFSATFAQAKTSPAAQR